MIEGIIGRIGFVTYLLFIFCVFLIKFINHFSVKEGNLISGIV